MTDHNVAEQIDQVWQRCCQPRHAARIARRWQRWPGLAGLDVTALRHRLAGTPTAEDNTVIVDLLRAHRSGDDDATCLLLAMFVPHVCSDPLLRINCRLVADRWAAVGHLLATVDPDRLNVTGTRPLWWILTGRMRRHATRYRDRTVLEAVDHDVICEDDEPTTHPDSVARHVFARHDLRTIGTCLRDGDIRRRTWRRLIDHRLYDRPDRDGRNSIRRTTRRLAVLTDRIA